MGAGKDLLRVKQAVRAERFVGAQCLCGAPGPIMCAKCTASMVQKIGEMMAKMREGRGK